MIYRPWQAFPRTILHVLSGNRLESPRTAICSSGDLNTSNDCSVTLNYLCLRLLKQLGSPTRVTSLATSADLPGCPRVLPAGRNEELRSKGG